METHRHQREPGEAEILETRGSVWNWARRYDLLMWIATLGRERTFRQQMAQLAQLHPSEEVLDVGCGTGPLAIIAQGHVGRAGRVVGIDPSRQMIAQARRKAKRANRPVDFQVGVIEQLVFPDQSFDVVLSTFMLHHLPDDLKRQGLADIVRVLKPGGRLFVLDLEGHSGPWKSRLADLPALMKERGFSQVETGGTRFSVSPSLGFAVGRKS